MTGNKRRDRQGIQGRQTGVLGWAGIGERGGDGMEARRQEGVPSPGWWIAVVSIDVAKMVGNWRASADVGTKSGECKVEDREEEARVSTGVPLYVDFLREFREIEPAAQ